MQLPSRGKPGATVFNWKIRRRSSIHNSGGRTPDFISAFFREPNTARRAGNSRRCAVCSGNGELGNNSRWRDAPDCIRTTAARLGEPKIAISSVVNDLVRVPAGWRNCESAGHRSRSRHRADSIGIEICKP